MNDEIARLIAAANAARLDGSTSDAEARLDALFCTSHTLAVYGTLAPGEANHHVVAPLGGEWTQGVIEGELHPGGWGAILGYPAFLPRSGGTAKLVKILTTSKLADAWPMLDEFEGPEYQRVLVPVFRTDGELLTVANLYAANEREPKASIRAYHRDSS